jgi:hypothetical protein
MSTVYVNTTNGIRFIVAGSATIVARMFATIVPVTYGGTTYTLSQAHGVCSSFAGQIAQGISANAAHNCGQVNTIYGLMNIAVLAAILAIIAGITMVVIERKSHDVSRP